MDEDGRRSDPGLREVSLGPWDCGLFTCRSEGQCWRRGRRVAITDPRILTHSIRRCDCCGALVITGHTLNGGGTTL